MKAKDEAALVAELQAMIPMSHGQRPWHERLTPEQAEQVDVMRNAWESGQLGPYRRRAARAISKKLQTLGLHIGEQGVEKWLRHLPTS